MKIENLDEDLENFIMEHLPFLSWEGTDSYASAPLILDVDECIEYDLMREVAKAIIACENEEFTLTIRPSENTLIIYYVD